MDIVAQVSKSVNAPKADVWQALIDPAKIKEYMFGADVESTWKQGSPIVWRGEFNGKPFEDRGRILAIEPETELSYSHYSPLSGPDIPENHHTVSISLNEAGPGTEVSLSQDNNPNEESKAESEKNWSAMLDGLKRVVEQDNHR